MLNIIKVVATTGNPHQKFSIQDSGTKNIMTINGIKKSNRVEHYKSGRCYPHQTFSSQQTKMASSDPHCIHPVDTQDSQDIIHQDHDQDIIHQGS